MQISVADYRMNTKVVFVGGTGECVLVIEFRSMALNGLFCADVLRPHDLVPLTDFTYKYHPGEHMQRKQVVNMATE